MAACVRLDQLAIEQDRIDATSILKTELARDGIGTDAAEGQGDELGSFYDKCLVSKCEVDPVNSFFFVVPMPNPELFGFDRDNPVVASAFRSRFFCPPLGAG